jgi:hypothetical protein
MTRKNQHDLAFLTTHAFSKEDYNSNDGMLTTVWGPSQWHVLHTMSFNYPVVPTSKDKRNYRNYILSLKNVLPCGKCRENLRKNFKKLPLMIKHMKSRHTFSKYIYDLHELVNEMLGKKSGLSYEQVRNTYENFRSRCLATDKEKEKIQRILNNTVKKESGCTKPLYGKKAKCILRIVPQEDKQPTFKVDTQCMKKLI